MKSYFFISWMPLIPLYMLANLNDVLKHNSLNLNLLIMKYQYKQFLLLGVYTNLLFAITPAIDAKMGKLIYDKYIPFSYAFILTFIVLVFSVFSHEDFYLRIKIIVIWILAFTHFFIRKGIHGKKREAR